MSSAAPLPLSERVWQASLSATEPPASSRPHREGRSVWRFRGIWRVPHRPSRMRGPGTGVGVRHGRRCGAADVLCPVHDRRGRRPRRHNCDPLWPGIGGAAAGTADPGRRSRARRGRRSPPSGVGGRAGGGGRRGAGQLGTGLRCPPRQARRGRGIDVAFDAASGPVNAGFSGTQTLEWSFAAVRPGGASPSPPRFNARRSTSRSCSARA
jgi:hypothetical protein